VTERSLGHGLMALPKESRTTTADADWRRTLAEFQNTIRADINAADGPDAELDVCPAEVVWRVVEGLMRTAGAQQPHLSWSGDDAVHMDWQEPEPISVVVHGDASVSAVTLRAERPEAVLVNRAGQKVVTFERLLAAVEGKR